MGVIVPRNINSRNVNDTSDSNLKVESATPKYTADWYLKWVASSFVLVAMSMRGVEGLQIYDLAFSLVGILGWLIVSILWNDRALIILNSFGLLFLLRNLFIYLT